MSDTPRPTLGPAKPVGVEVDVFGRLFKVGTVTRSRQRGFDDLLGRLNDENVQADADRMVGVIGELFDLVLEPSNGQRVKPSKLLMEKWEGDELDLRSVLAFFYELQEAVENPPT